MPVMVRLPFLMDGRTGAVAVPVMMVAGIVRLRDAQPGGSSKNALDRRRKADRDDDEQAKELAAH